MNETVKKPDKDMTSSTSSVRVSLPSIPSVTPASGSRLRSGSTIPYHPSCMSPKRSHSARIVSGTNRDSTLDSNGILTLPLEKLESAKDSTNAGDSSSAWKRISSVRERISESQSISRYGSSESLSSMNGSRSQTASPRGDALRALMAKRSTSFCDRSSMIPSIVERLDKYEKRIADLEAANKNNQSLTTRIDQLEKNGEEKKDKHKKNDSSHDKKHKKKKTDPNVIAIAERVAKIEAHCTTLSSRQDDITKKTQYKEVNERLGTFETAMRKTDEENETKIKKFEKTVTELWYSTDSTKRTLEEVSDKLRLSVQDSDAAKDELAACIAEASQQIDDLGGGFLDITNIMATHEQYLRELERRVTSVEVHVGIRDKNDARSVSPISRAVTEEPHVVHLDNDSQK